MDILSLFEFKYSKYHGSNSKTLFIYNYKSVLDSLNNRILNKELNYIDPILIADISDKTTDNESMITEQDIEAAIVYNMIKNSKEK